MSRAWIDTMVRPSLLAFEPYRSARSGAPRDVTPRVRLDANEWGGEDGPSGLERYPEPQPPGLREAYAAFVGAPAASIFVGRGADEAIDVLTRVFCEAGRDAILVTPPTYGYYEVAARLQGAAVAEAPLVGDGFDLDERRILAAVDAREGPRVKLVYVCSPNNPTGNAFDPGRLADLAAALEGRALLVVDEAYVELADRPSLAGVAAARENLVVLRTFSKALGLAGARVGAAVAAPATIAWLQRTRAPYPLSAPQIEAALRVLGRADRLLPERKRFVAAERRRLAAELAALGAVERVWPSEANFLLVRMAPGAEGVAAALARRGILIRDRRADPGLQRCVRISIGNRAENDALLGAMDALLAASSEVLHAGV